MGNGADARPCSKNSIDGADDQFEAVCVDRNLVSNMLQAYRGEQGLPGPASTLLHGLGVPPSQLQRAPHSSALDSDDDPDDFS